MKMNLPRMWRNFLLAALLPAVTTLVPATVARADDAPKAPVETKEQHDARMGWWREARFGMFIHWGVYSVPAGEWNGKTDYAEWFLEQTHMPVSQYEQYAKQFNPVKFNAKEWVAIAKDAGMKYIVITSKHHDGFDMYPSELTDWCIKSTPFGRDPLKELAEACKEAGIRFCTYHSIMDWHHPDWGTRRAWNDKATGTPDMDRFDAYLKGQLKEVVTHYHPGVMWFDGEWETPWTPERGADLYAYLRNLDPALIINNRIGKARAGMEGMDTGAGAVGDFGTPEQTIPANGFGPGVDWESCMTLNNHWGYNKHDQNWKSPTTVIRNTIDIASKGGNYLLNVGPTAEGLIPDGSVQCLKAVGAWMKVNGTAICGTTAGPFKKALAWGRVTAQPGKLYLHVFEWPQDGKLAVAIGNKVSKAYLLAAPDTALDCTSGESGAVLRLPGTAPDPIASVAVLEIDGAPQVIATAAVTQAADGTMQLAAQTADLVGSGIKLQGEPRKNVGFWLNASDYVQWPVQVTKAGKFTVTLECACQADSAGSEYTVTVGDQTLAGKVESTDGWDKYSTVGIGSVSIAQPGMVMVVVKATKKPGLAVMNLRALTLKPE